MRLWLAGMLALLATAQPARAAQQLAEAYVAPVPAGQYPDDPADSLYTAARAAMAQQRYARAAELFHQITAQYPSSSYAADAAYYEAFSRSRLGDIDNLRRAYDILSQSATKLTKDAASLQAEVCGKLVRKGDPSCKQNLITKGKEPTAHPDPDKCPSEDDDIRISALNALMQVDADKAMPILKQVLQKRDACSLELRKKALFLVSQKAGSDGADILLDVARNDPDQEIRERAVFWLSQVRDPRAVGMLDSLLLHASDDGLRQKALYALSQQRDRGWPMLRAFASDASQPEDLREIAIYWIGQNNDPDNQTWLRQDFRRETSEEIKEKILFAISQHHSTESGDWLLGIATDTTQSVELRKKAIFWAGQGSASLEQLVGLYGRAQDHELKEALIFAYSQRHESAAVDELMTIAKTDKDPEMRKKAMFWLGQSHDPRIVKFFQDVINQ